MHFGFTNAPGTFMRSMNEFLKEFIGNFVILYLDDILIYIQTKEEHLRLLKMVLSTLQKEILFINLKKCSFMKREPIYLGFLVFEEGLKMDQEKVQAIDNWPTLRSSFEVRSLHGLTSFYRKFIRSFNQICEPILETIKETKQPFKWTEVDDTKFKLLKKKIIENPMLDFLSFEKFFQVQTDANGTVIGVVLLRLIAYFSEKLNEEK
jgi:hypothetical protein